MIMEELSKFIGQTVIIFTISGGATGRGFTGVLLRANTSFVTLVNRLGAPPNWPLDEILSCGFGSGENELPAPVYIVSSICDIPLTQIAAFCHNTFY